MRTSKPFASHCQISFLIHALSNGIEGQTLLSMLSDGLIEEQLIFGVVITGEGRGKVSDSKVEG